MVRALAPFAVLAGAFALAACSLVPGSRGDGTKPARPAAGSGQAPVVSAENRVCLARLAQRGADFTALPDRYFGGGCTTLGSVKLAALETDRGSITLANIGPVTCPLADTLEGWARFGVDRAAQQILGAPLSQIETFGSYACRNVAGSSRRSAHSRAEAVDVSAFILRDGRRVSVLDDWSEGTQAERTFLRTVRESACKRFGTVLSPEYNAAHRDHLHLEMGDGTFCR